VGVAAGVEGGVVGEMIGVGLAIVVVPPVTLVGSLAVLLVEFGSPAVATVAVLTVSAAATEDTFTLSAMVVKTPAGRALLLMHLTVAPPVQLQPLPDADA
jgi:uncharacterized membrane protein YfcA